MISHERLHRVEHFLYREARLIDERRFGEWEALRADDGLYWVPANGDDTDPDRDVSLIYDSRDRLHTRVERYTSGQAHSQDPPPRTTRVVSNIDLEPAQTDADDDGPMVVHPAFQLTESRPNCLVGWAGRTTHHLVEPDRELRIAFKKVVLVNNDQELTALDFLL